MKTVFHPPQPQPLPIAIEMMFQCPRLWLYDMLAVFRRARAHNSSLIIPG